MTRPAWPALLAHRDKPAKPFRCLDPQYRRELVRVYLTNVEGICRRFCEEKRTRLAWAKDELRAFRDFWDRLEPGQKGKLLTEKAEAVLKVRRARMGRSGGGSMPLRRCHGPCAVRRWPQGAVGRSESLTLRAVA